MPADLRITIDPRGTTLDDALDRVSGPALDAAMGSAMQQAVLHVEADAKEAVPQVTRALHRSIAGRVVTPWQGVVKAGGDGVDYARAVEDGTGPHEIRPRRARLLRWKGPDGRYRFARRVRHPGTRAQPYMRPAMAQNVDRIKGLFADAVRSTFRGRGG